MKIDRIEVYGYDLSYRYGKYVMSGNQVINSIPSTVVRILTDSGIEGWGEVCPLGPLYLASHGLGARAALQQMLPALNELDPTNLSAIHAAMNASLRGHSYAKSAIDMACWDILGKDAGKDAFAENIASICGCSSIISSSPASLTRPKLARSCRSMRRSS